MGCRKNATNLTPDERSRFVEAVLQLKQDGKYDQYAEIHAHSMAHGHDNSAYLPWHRELIRRFEQDLKAFDASVALPYWNWAVANRDGSGADPSIWADDFMGGPGDPVTTGPFKDWGIRRRNFDINTVPDTAASLTEVIDKSSYLEFRTSIENLHNHAKRWLGGEMNSITTAAKDPVFFLLLCNVDRVWAEWVEAHRDERSFAPYLPVSGAPIGHNLNDTMWPWNRSSDPILIPGPPEEIRPADLLDHTALDYCYDTIPDRPAPEASPRYVSYFDCSSRVCEVVVMNVQDKEAVCRVSVYSRRGSSVWSDEIKLGPHQTEQFRLNRIVKQNRVGMVTVAPMIAGYEFPSTLILTDKDGRDHRSDDPDQFVPFFRVS